MTYDEAMNDDETVTYQDAVNEYNDHGLNDNDLVGDLGYHHDYKASDVLTALGY